MKKIRLLIIVVAAIPSVGWAGIFGGPSNYDECMVDRMKGQDRYMAAIVKRTCERDFEVKLSNTSLVDLRWGKTTGRGVVVGIETNDSDFEITRAILKFSEKSCDDSKKGDYTVQAEADFTSWIPGKGASLETEVSVEQPQLVHCMQTLEFYGKRIK